MRPAWLACNTPGTAVLRGGRAVAAWRGAPEMVRGHGAVAANEPLTRRRRDSA